MAQMYRYTVLGKGLRPDNTAINEEQIKGQDLEDRVIKFLFDFDLR